MEPCELAWMDQADAKLKAVVQRDGYQIQMVGYGRCDMPGCQTNPADAPPFAYTVGLCCTGHPELLVFGLPRDVTADVLRQLAGRVVDGERLAVGQPITVEGWWQRFVPEVLPNPDEVLLRAASFHPGRRRQVVRALQLAHDDIFGRFPWETGYANPSLQPRPGTFRA